MKKIRDIFVAVSGRTKIFKSNAKVGCFYGDKFIKFTSIFI